MPLKVIGAGYGRTGTESLREAFLSLGMPCYHMLEVFKHPATDLAFWSRVASAPAGTAFDWEKEVFNKDQRGYVVSVDNPACCVWKELVAAYPEAIVLLSLHPRGPQAWYESSVETIYAVGRALEVPPLSWLSYVIPWVYYFRNINHLLWLRNLRGTMDDRERAVQEYLDHIDEVKRFVPAERLLVWDASQGWAPLCDKLGIPVPDRPFPRVNDRQQMRRAMTIAKWVFTALGVAVVASAAFGARSLYRYLYD